jgi:transposase
MDEEIDTPNLPYYHAPTHEGSRSMRGSDEQTGAMFSYVSLEERVPSDHPLRAIRRITDRALARISPELGALYIHFGRPSIPPERLLRALVLQALYTIRSERQLMEQLDYNLLFRWFVGLGVDDVVWAPTTFSKNRDRLLTGQVAAAFFDAVLIHAEVAVRRALYRRRHPAGSLGQPEEFPPTRPRPAGVRRRQRLGGLSWPAPHQRDACVNHRSRCALV